MLRKVISCYLLSITCILLMGCTGDFTYSTYPCYLVIDNATHLDATLASAMNSLSPGVFCQVTSNETAKRYCFRNNSGLTSEIAFTAIDQRLTRSLGMNNGIIVGFASLTGEFCAYDRECPVCFNPDAIPVISRPLTMSDDGFATCSVCHRRWNMNTGGNYAGSTVNDSTATEGVGNLTRYRCGTTGPYGILSVGN